jgi:hypothetical protein
MRTYDVATQTPPRGFSPSVRPKLLLARFHQVWLLNVSVATSAHGARNLARNRLPRQLTKRTPLGGDIEKLALESRWTRLMLGRVGGVDCRRENRFAHNWPVRANSRRHPVNQKSTEPVVEMFGSAGRIRAYKPSVSSRLGCRPGPVRFRKLRSSRYS